MISRLSLFALLGLSLVSASPIASTLHKRESTLPEAPEGVTVTPDNPDTPGRRIRLQDREDLCLTVQGGYAAYGTNVEISGCWPDNATFIEEQLFDVSRPYRGQIPLTGKPYMCLDGGDLSNGSGVTIEACEDGKESQIFTLGTTGSGDKPKLRAQVGYGNQCLDVDVNSSPSYQKPYNSVLDLQIWECHPTDTPDNNQWIELI
ncbi:hypothetical protein IAU59_001083 [Kwoniella sp. CBS 9459]